MDFLLCFFVQLTIAFINGDTRSHVHPQELLITYVFHIVRTDNRRGMSGLLCMCIGCCHGTVVYSNLPSKRENKGVFVSYPSVEINTTKIVQKKKESHLSFFFLNLFIVLDEHVNLRKIGYSDSINKTKQKYRLNNLPLF
jgi:hypothetical protein